jgi:hypothetical protein
LQTDPFIFSANERSKGVEMTTELNLDQQDDRELSEEEETSDENPTEQKKPEINMQIRGGSSDTVYALGLIGAWVYYIGRATSFQQGVAGFFKGLVWPAFLVYDLFKFLDKNKD